MILSNMTNFDKDWASLFIRKTDAYWWSCLLFSFAEVIGIISKDTVNPGVSTSPLIFAPFEWTQTDPICNAVWQFCAHSIHKKEGFSFVTVVYTRQIIFWQQQYISDHEFFARKEAALFHLKCFELVNDVFSDTLKYKCNLLLFLFTIERTKKKPKASNKREVPLKTKSIFPAKRTK